MSRTYRLLLPAASVPPGNGWLSQREEKIQAGLHLEKRRRDWRLGRHTAKRLLIESGLVPADDLRRLSIEAAADGAPEAWLDGRPAGVTLSISHAAGHGVAAAARGRLALGSDLERIEPRSAGFLDTFFTPAEVRQARSAADPALVANLIWSAKESWLKACRSGLRRDTRSVEITILPPPEADVTGRGDWRAFAVWDLAQGRRGHGWWRRVSDELLWTIAGDAPAAIARDETLGAP